MAKVRVVTVPSIIIAMATGVARAAMFKEYEHPAEVSDSLMTVMIVKHVVFAVLVIGGICIHAKSASFFKRASGADGAQAQEGSA